MAQLVEGSVGGPAGEPLLVHPGQSQLTGWAADALDLFKRRMSDAEPPFPCIFGVDATRRGTLRLTFVPAGPRRLDHLAAALVAFAEQAQELGRRTSLVAIFEPDSALATLEDYRAEFWSMLSVLRERDTEPWPEGISRDTEHPEWEFSFHGVPLFVVVNTPVHKRRRSRYFEYFAITFQPRFVFDDLAETSPQGQRARAIIRSRLAEYDELGPAPVLGSFGVVGNREWIQYFLEDDNDTTHAGVRCPMHS
ncbi:MAG TPA: YqcI/YcgG family protein [Micromonosporaceae bacterium]